MTIIYTYRVYNVNTINGKNDNFFNLLEWTNCGKIDEIAEFDRQEAEMWEQ